MEFWNDIINTSMIGTDKKMISAADLPAEMADAAERISTNTKTDKEEKFLQLAALAFNYRQSGMQPVHKETISLPAASAEEKKYCNPGALQALKDIRSEESTPLLKLWLEQCNAKQQIVQPDMLPDLFSIAVQEKQLQPLVAGCSGNRGVWLGRFNEAWNFSQNQTNEEFWQTGSTAQRRMVFAQMRRIDPDSARTLLQQTWSQEDATAKIGFLEILSINISEKDIPFLESLLTEKSKKVKEEVFAQLKKIPASSIIQQYQEVLQQSVELKKEKALLGLTSKTSLHFHLPATVDEDVFRSGIDKLSNNKVFTDDEFIIYQLIQAVPPSFWEKQLASSPENIINYFQKHLVGKKMIPALVLAIRQFNDANWAFLFMQYSEVFYLDVLPLLPLKQQEYYSNHFFSQNSESIIQYAVQRKDEWGIELAKNIFKHAAKNPYQYNRSFFNRNIHLIPLAIVGELEKCTPPEEGVRTMWSNTSEYIIKLVTIKIQTLKAFNE